MAHLIVFVQRISSFVKGSVLLTSGIGAHFHFTVVLRLHGDST